MKTHLQIVFIVFLSSMFLAVFSQTLITDPANGGNGGYCASGPGVLFVVENSVNLTDYNLERFQGGAWATIENALTGDGGTVWFTNPYVVGANNLYRLVDEFGTVFIPEVTVEVHPLPNNSYTVTIPDNGEYCFYGANQAFPIGLDDCESSNITYNLYFNGGNTPVASVPGNDFNAPINFGWFNGIGTYTVWAVNQYGCEIELNNSVEIIANAPPTAQFVAPVNLGCSTDPVQFNDGSIAGDGVITEWFWDFNDPLNPEPTSYEQNPIHQFWAFGPGGQQTFNVVLTVTDDNGCTSTVNHDITVTERPHARLGDEPFRQCSDNPTFDLQVFNRSSTAATNTAYSIDWGEGNGFEPITMPFDFNDTRSHTYTAQGYWELTIEAVGPGPDFCTDQYTYPVYNGTDPIFGMISNGLSICVGEDIEFIMPLAVYDNTPGTHYYIDWGDGEIPEEFDQNQLDILYPNPPGTISHTYANSSCGELNNSFTIHAVCSNLCSAPVTVIGPVEVSSPASADFERDEFPVDPIFACINTHYQFHNDTEEGCIIDNGIVYNNTSYSWDFGDPGSGTSNTSNLENPDHVYNVPGLYTVTLEAITENGGLNCGASIMTRQVCVQGLLQVDFAPNAVDGCIDTYLFVPTNNTTGGACGGYDNTEYTWAFVPNTVTYTGETNSHSFEPQVSFANAGIYTVTLTAANCVGLTTTVPIDLTLTDKPDIVLADPDDLCGLGQIAFVPVYTDNGDPIDVYEWDIQGGAFNFVPPTNAGTANVTIEFLDEISQYFVMVRAHNACGFSDWVSVIVNVIPPIEDNIITGDQIICQGDIPLQLEGFLPIGGNGTYEYLWEESIDNGTTWDSASGLGNDNQNYQSPQLSVTTCYRRIVNSWICVDDYSNVVVISVIEGITNNIITSDQEICEGDTPNLLTGSMPVGGNGIFMYLWQESTDGSLWVDADTDGGVNSITDPTYQPPALVQTTQYRRVVTNDPPGECDNISLPVTVTVALFPQITNVNHNLFICSGDQVDFIPTSDVAGTTFEWFSTNQSPGCINGVSVNGSGNINDILTNTCLTEQVVEYIITAIGPAPVFCEGASFELIVTVNPEINVDAGQDQNIGNGQWTTLNGIVSGGTPPYQFYWEPAALICTGQGTLTPTTCLLNSNTVFTLSVTDANGCENTDNAFIFVGANPFSVTATANPEVICIGGISQLNAIPQFGSGNYIYSWVSNPPGFNSNLQDPVVNPIVTTTYTVAVDDGFNQVIDNVTVTVAQAPQITSPLTMEICSNQAVGYVPTSDVGGSTFDWVSNGNACIWESVDAGVGNIDATLINNCVTPESITYSVTPTGPAPIFCQGVPQDVIVTVNPYAHIVNTPGEQTIISGQQPVNVVFDSDVAGVTYEWSTPGNPNLSPPYDGLLNGNGDLDFLSTGPISILPVGANIENLVFTIIPIYHGANIDCQGDEFTYTVIINQAPSIYSVLGGGEFCDDGGSCVDIMLSGSEIGIEYQLMLNGVSVGNVLVGTATPLEWACISESGTYTVLGINQNTGASILMNGNAIVEAIPMPVVYAGSDASTCVNTLYTIPDANVVNESSFMWVVTVGNGVIIESTTISPTYVPAPIDAGTTVVITLCANGTGECLFETICDTLELYIEPFPMVFAGADASICVSSIYQIPDATVEFYSSSVWEVTVGDGVIDNPNILAPTYIPALNDAGTTVVLTLCANGNGACSTETVCDDINIDIIQSPEANFVYENTCVSQPTNFYDQSEPGIGTIIEWQWDFGDGTSSSLQNPSYIYSEAGTYEVGLTVTNSSGCQDNFSQPIVINGLPEVNLEPYELVCLNWPSFELTGGMPEGGNYTGSGVTDNWFDPGTAGLGSHIITYTYADANGCEDSAEEGIYVDACTGVTNNPISNGIFIYPNPNNGRFTIKINSEKDDIINIRVINLLGEPVYGKRDIPINKGYREDIDLRSCPDGLYYVLITGKNTYIIKKVIIR